jgi:predicted O-methyltransferase YrrM
MFVVGTVKGTVRGFRSRRQVKHLLAAGTAREITAGDWASSLEEPTAFYGDCFRYFHFRLPIELRTHRTYFEQDHRGFGEAAFHTMWFLLFRELRPRAFLEIGVYRGQTLSLAALLQRRLEIDGRVVGVSPFSNARDSVCSYRANVNYREDTLANFRYFDLEAPELITGFSTDEHAVDAISGSAWDCVYIDGNHDYEVVRTDWENAASQVRPGGIIVLDDAGLTTRFKAPAFAMKGLPGPSRLAAEVGNHQYTEILQVGHNRVFQHCA